MRSFKSGRKPSADAVSRHSRLHARSEAVAFRLSDKIHLSIYPQTQAASSLTSRQGFAFVLTRHFHAKRFHANREIRERPCPGDCTWTFLPSSVLRTSCRSRENRTADRSQNRLLLAESQESRPLPFPQTRRAFSVARGSDCADKSSTTLFG